MFIKQTIDLFEHRIDENLIKEIWRGNRYKQYKFSMRIDNKKPYQAKMINQMLDEMPELEIDQIKIVNEINSTLHNLVQKPIFMTSHELLKVIKTYVPEHFCTQPSEPDEYVSKIFYPEEHDMS